MACGRIAQRTLTIWRGVQGSLGPHSIDVFLNGPARYLCSTSAGSRELVFRQRAGHHAEEQLVVNLAGGAVAGRHRSTDSPHPLSPAYLRSAARRQLAATFLPAGYPDSVAPGYLRFVWWQALHHFAGSVNGVLASTFLLYSVGLGAGAIPTAGALNWVLKDGLGQLGTLLFGKTIAHSFDINSRAWYLAASAKLNVAMGLEVCTLLAPQWFLPMGAVANAVKGLAWMSGGSSRSAFNVAFAADNNIADITAKATSQTICSSMAGVALASQIGQALGPALASFAAVAVLHMYTSLASARCVPLATLNPTRLQLLVSCYLGQLPDSGQQEGWHLQQAPLQQPHGESKQPWAGEHMQPLDSCSRGSSPLPTPSQLAELEPIVTLAHWHGSSGFPRLEIGASLLEQHRQRPELLAAVLPLFACCSHVLIPPQAGRGGALLVFHEQATTKDCILAVLHAQLYYSQGRGLGTGGSSNGGSSTDGSRESNGSGPSGVGHEGGRAAGVAATVSSSLAAAQRLLPGLLAGLAASGWDVGKVVLETTRRRAVW